MSTMFVVEISGFGEKTIILKWKSFGHIQFDDLKLSKLLYHFQTVSQFDTKMLSISQQHNCGIHICSVLTISAKLLLIASTPDLEEL